MKWEWILCGICLHCGQLCACDDFWCNAMLVCVSFQDFYISFIWLYTLFAVRWFAVIFLSPNYPVGGYTTVWVCDSELFLQQVMTRCTTCIHKVNLYYCWHIFMNVSWLFIYTAMLLKSNEAPSLEWSVHIKRLSCIQMS